MLEINKKKKYYQYIQIISVLTIILIASGYYYFRFIVNANLREIVPRKVYCSAQPSENLLGKWAKKYGIKTIINLRAQNLNDTGKEGDVSKELGLKLIPLNLSGNRLVSSSEMVNLINVLETAQKPLLLHCKSGIDRSGFTSAIAAMVIGRLDFDKAMHLAYVPPGPWKRKDFSKTRADYVHDYAHISDTLYLYEDYCKKNDLNKNNLQELKKWAAEMPSIEKPDINYEPAYSYFPLPGSGKHFFPIYKLLKRANIQFSVEILIVILLIYHTKFCLKQAWKK